MNFSTDPVEKKSLKSSKFDTVSSQLSFEKKYKNQSKDNTNNNYDTSPIFFDEPKQLYIPRHTESHEIPENRQILVKENFSSISNVSSSKNMSFYEFIGRSQKLDPWKPFQLNPKLCENIYKASYKKPKEIQKCVIPLFLKGKCLDVIGNTGCGKSVSYIISIINQIADIKSQTGYSNINRLPLAIIIVPTIEIALQISDEIVKLSSDINVSCSRVIGGFSFECNINEVFHECDIIVTTVGKLCKMLKASNFRLLKYLIIDEYSMFVRDKISDNFSKLMLHFKNTLSKMDVQVSMFTSVSSSKVARFLKSCIGKDFTTIDSSKNPEFNKINYIFNRKTIHKVYFVMKISDKPKLLLKIIRNIIENDINTNSLKCTRIVIFTEKLSWSKELTNYICNEMPFINCREFNGKLTLEKRKDYLEEFQKTIAKIQVLVSTDFVNREINIYSLNHVINYDLPSYFGSFHHRIERINKGIVHTIISKNDSYDQFCIPNLTNFLNNIGQLSDVLKENFDDMLRNSTHKY